MKLKNILIGMVIGFIAPFLLFLFVQILWNIIFWGSNFWMFGLDALKIVFVISIITMIIGSIIGLEYPSSIFN